MTRCVDFYRKFDREGNFCGLSSAAVSLINAYKKIVEEELTSRGLDPEFTFVNFSEGASRPLHKIEDKVLLGKVLDDIAGRIKMGGSVTAADVKTWIDLESNNKTLAEPRRDTFTNVNNSISEPSVKPADPPQGNVLPIGKKAAPSGWHPSTSNCQGCARLGYEKDPKSKKLCYICTAAKPAEGYLHGRPPYGMESCPLGTGPVQVACRFWGEDTLCHNPHTMECTAATRGKYHCPLGGFGSGEPQPALGLMRRQAYRNPQSGSITTAYCQNKPGVGGCKHLKKREMNNTYECELEGKVPGNLRNCPLDEKKGDEWTPEYEAKYPVTAACKAIGCFSLRYIKPGLHTCGFFGLRPENMPKGKLPEGCPKLPPVEPEPAQPAPAAPLQRVLIAPPSHPNLQRYTVEANRQDQMALRQMIQRGLAEDEDEAVQSCFEEGLNLFMDRIEAQIQKEEEDQEVLGE